MPSSSPIFEIVGDFELTDEFIDSLADLLLEVGERERAVKAANPPAPSPTAPAPPEAHQ